MRKTYILDTNVLLHDPGSLTRFVDNDVIIPIDVIEEIDRFKHELTERGHNAREVSRRLDALRDGMSLANGIRLDNEILLRVYWDGQPLSAPPGRADNNILAAAGRIQQQQPDRPVIIVSKDINLRLRADAMGLKAQDYTADKVIPTDAYDGQAELTLTRAQIDELESTKSLPTPPDVHLHPNEYVLLRTYDEPPASILGRADRTGKTLHPIRIYKAGLCGIQPRNKEQYFAIDALTDEDIKLVTLMGKAGTGKTLIAMAGALHETLVKKRYRGMVVARPTVPVGKELGFLPGDIGEKMSPWIKPVIDTLEFIFDTAGHLGGHKQCDSLLSAGLLEIQAISLIRGRSINNRYIVVDEAQNLSPLEVKTIITRVEQNAKVILTGDPYQIDNPYVDSSSNGFNYLVNRFRDEALSAHVELTKGERSELAELAANLL